MATSPPTSLRACSPAPADSRPAATPIASECSTLRCDRWRRSSAGWAQSPSSDPHDPTAQRGSATCDRILLDTKSRVRRELSPYQNSSARGANPMIIRPVVIALVAALMLAGSGPASAQQGKCIAGKTKCLSKKGTGLLKCETNAETPGKPTDPNTGDCVTKVDNKFTGGTEPTKGCFEKLESKTPNDCATLDDTAAGEAAVDSCVASLVTAIDPPPTDQNKCGAGKKKCVSKLFAALLKCNQLAQTPKKPTDPNANGCVDKAISKYTGGLEPTKGCFAKLEAKPENGCLPPTDNSATLQGLVENCADTLAALVTAGGSTTSTTAATSTTATTSSTVTSTTTMGTTTTTTMPGGTGLQGALTKTLGRFNFAGGIGLPGALTQCQN